MIDNKSRTILLAATVAAAIGTSTLVPYVLRVTGRLATDVVFGVTYGMTNAISEVAGVALDAVEDTAVIGLAEFDKVSPILNHDIHNLLLATSRGTRYLTIESTLAARDMYAAARNKKVPNRNNAQYSKFANAYEMPGGTFRPAVVYLGHGIKFAGKEVSKSIGDVREIFSEVK